MAGADNRCPYASKSSPLKNLHYILESATQDLIHGFKFYEQQEMDLGSYFMGSLFSDIDSLLIFAGIHRKHCGVDSTDNDKGIDKCNRFVVADGKALAGAVVKRTSCHGIRHHYCYG